MATNLSLGQIEPRCKIKSFRPHHVLLPGHKCQFIYKTRTKKFQIQIRVNHVLTAQVQLKSFQNKSNRSVHCTRTRIAWQQEVSNENTDLSAYRQKLKGHDTFSLTQPSHEDPGTLEEVPAHSIRTSTRRNPSLSSI